MYARQPLPAADGFASTYPIQPADAYFCLVPLKRKLNVTRWSLVDIFKTVGRKERPPSDSSVLPDDSITNARPPPKSRVKSNRVTRTQDSHLRSTLSRNCPSPPWACSPSSTLFSYKVYSASCGTRSSDPAP